MYRCEVCRKVVAAGISCSKIVKHMPWQHPYRCKVQRKWGFDKNGRKKLEWVDDIGNANSLQIAREISACEACAKKYDKDREICSILQ